MQAVVGDLNPASTFPVDRTLADVSAADFAGLVLPGGTVNADTLRTDVAAQNLVRAFVEQRKPIAAICHAPWTLIEADVIAGKTTTSYPSLKHRPAQRAGDLGGRGGRRRRLAGAGRS